MRPLRIILGWMLGALLAALVVAYLGDALWIRVKLWTGGAAKVYGSVVVMPAVALKGQKYEIYANDGTPVACAHSLFPQLGRPACWYVKRHEMNFLN